MQRIHIWFQAFTLGNSKLPITQILVDTMPSSCILGYLHICRMHTDKQAKRYQHKFKKKRTNICFSYPTSINACPMHSINRAAVEMPAFHTRMLILPWILEHWSLHVYLCFRLYHQDDNKSSINETLVQKYS